jgi:NADH dehydrogenase FAD-containing subunit
VSGRGKHAHRKPNEHTQGGEQRRNEGSALDEVLRPIGVKRVEAEVTEIDVARRRIVCAGSGPALPFDRLVFALGSRLVRPPIPGLAEHAFDVDTYDGGCRLNAHIVALPAREPSPGHWTALVIGGGLTRIEAAAELPGKLRAVLDGMAGTPRALSLRILTLKDILDKRATPTSCRSCGTSSPRAGGRVARRYATP